MLTQARHGTDILSELAAHANLKEEPHVDTAFDVMSSRCDCQVGVCLVSGTLKSLAA